MKNFFATLLILFSLGGSFALFAEEAATLPARVGRLYVVPAYAFANKAYDEDGKSHNIPDGAGSLKAFNLSFALEYGITSWISAAVQWAPGWNIWSEIDNASAPFNFDFNANGVYDLFVGAKIQLVGAVAPIKTNMFRFSVAPGVKIPMPGADIINDKEFATDYYAEMLAGNLKTGDKVTAANPDKHAWGFGARFYFDWVINEHFFIDLYNETIFYPVEADLAMFRSSVIKAKYGYDLTFEIEPRFQTALSDAVTFKAGVPVAIKINPDVEDTDGNVLSDKTKLLTVGPSLYLFLTKTPLPLEFQAQYKIPVYGESTRANNTLAFTVKAYFKI